MCVWRLLSQPFAKRDQTKDHARPICTDGGYLCQICAAVDSDRRCASHIVDSCRARTLGWWATAAARLRRRRSLVVGISGEVSTRETDSPISFTSAHFASNSNHKTDYAGHGLNQWPQAGVIKCTQNQDDALYKSTVCDVHLLSGTDYLIQFWESLTDRFYISFQNFSVLIKPFGVLLGVFIIRK